MLELGVPVEVAVDDPVGVALAEHVMICSLKYTPAPVFDFIL